MIPTVFKHPSGIELEHDFLWRTTRDPPEWGRIGIFNRSYYKEVLILRVHPELLSAEALVDTPGDDKRRSLVCRSRGPQGKRSTDRVPERELLSIRKQLSK